MLTINGLKKAFGETAVLKGLDAEVVEGQVISIIGPSGSGKSTFLRCLNFLEIADAGTMIFSGKSYDLAKTAAKEQLYICQSMGMVFQSFQLFAHQTVLQNVMEALLTVKRKSKTEAKEIAEHYLTLVGLQEKAEAYPAQLSGGQQQRVAIARSLALEPKLLLLDEPTSALDPELVNEVLTLIKKIAQSGMTMLIVTHEMRFAFEISDRIIFMDQGLIVESGTPDEILKSKQPRTQQFLNPFFSQIEYYI